MYGPVIEGKLFRLRPPTPEDAPAIIKWFEDVEVTHFLDNTLPPSLEAEREWLDKTGRDPNFIYWIIEHDGRAVGGTGIMQIDWKHGHGLTGTIIGDKAVWGKGIAREMMQLRAHYAFTQTPLRKLKSRYVDGNVASARAQKAAGYKEVGRLREEVFRDGKWKDMILTELLRSDWEQVVRIINDLP